MKRKIAKNSLGIGGCLLLNFKKACDVKLNETIQVKSISEKSFKNSKALLAGSSFQGISCDPLLGEFHFEGVIITSQVHQLRLIIICKCNNSCSNDFTRSVGLNCRNDEVPGII